MAVRRKMSGNKRPALYEFFAPAGVDPSASEVERDAFALTTIMALIAGAIFAPVYFIIGDPHGATAILFFGIPLGCAPLLLRMTGSVKFALHWLCGAELCILSYLAYRQGGVDNSAAIWWTLLVPWAYWTAGIYRPGLLWLGMVLLSVGGLYGYEVFIGPLSSFRGDNPLLLYVVSITGFFAISLGYLALADRFRRKAFAELMRTNIELEKARDAALKAAQVKAQFLANMSHEIRTPMHGMLGTAQLLETMPLSVDAKHLVKTVTQSGETLLSLINDVLDFSRIEAGQLTLDDAVFSPAKIVEDVAHLLAARVYEKGLEISCHTAAGLPTMVRGDPLRLRQVLANLLSNAIKFTDHGEVTISATRLQEEGGQVRLRFEVADTGIGIAPEQRERLFKAFSQLDESSTRRYGGSGLGLAISHDLTALMGGAISIEGDLGKGSRFIVDIPFSQETTAGSTEASPLEGTVLLLEPHAASRRAVSEKLVQAGAHVIAPEWPLSVAALNEAITTDTGTVLVSSAVLQDEPPEGMVGRNEVVAIHWPCIVMAPFGQTAVWSRAANAVAAVIAKPVRMPELIEVLSDARRDHENLHAMRTAVERAPGAPRVLVAEDNPVNQKIAVAMLERIGCSVDVVADGEAAVNGSAGGAYDLVLMDCQMPVLDGFDATRGIRERERQTGERRTAIVALTASALTGDREACLAAGMDDYIAKPFQMDQLEETVRKWAERKSESCCDKSLPRSPGA